MAYNQNIPLATDPLKVSQSGLLANFQELFTFFGVNHVNFGVADQGKHNFLQMPEQGAAPATAVNECALYSAVGAISTVTELVFRRENNGITIPFTEGSNTVLGWGRLPSGMVMKWNTVTVLSGDAGADVILNVPLTGPVLTTTFWGIVVPAATLAAPTTDINAACYVTSLTSAQINYKIWRRAAANTPGNGGIEMVVTALLLGVE